MTSKATPEEVISILREAQALLRMDGWCQYKFRDNDTGCRCMMGAVIAACTRLYGTVGYTKLHDATTPIRALLPEQYRGAITSWNDAKDRDMEQVLDVLEAAALMTDAIEERKPPP